jgi:hypothetical protein
MLKKLVFPIICLAFISGIASAQAKAQAVEQPNGTPHQTVLQWTASAPVSGVTIAGYNVYKSTTKGGESATKSINSTLITGTTYTDTSVVPGQTAFYVVDAQATTGNQSGPSNEVSATTPSNPNPPVLSAAIVSMNISGKKETIVAQFSETTPGTEVAYELWGSGKLLQRGTSTSSTQTISWSGQAVNGVKPVLTVADASGAVASSD